MWRDAATRLAAAEAALTRHGISRADLDRFETYVREGARELVAPKRIIEFAAEWYETQMGRFTGRIEGEDEAAADEIDKILNS